LLSERGDVAVQLGVGVDLRCGDIDWVCSRAHLTHVGLGLSILGLLHCRLLLGLQLPGINVLHLGEGCTLKRGVIHCHQMTDIPREAASQRH
jgi:hypothetical protein